MPTGKEFNVTLPPEMSDFVTSKVASGEYASESDVLLDGVRVLADQDRTFEDWLLSDVVPAYDALHANPGSTLSENDVRASLAAEYAKKAGAVW